MQILWATIDRSKQADGHIFTALQKEVAKLINVDFIVRTIPTTGGDLCGQVMLQGKKTTPLLDITQINNTYDFIFTDAIFAFMNEEWNKINIPKGILIEDQQGPMVRKYLRTAYELFKFTIFCMRYKNPVPHMHPYIKDFIWIPHSIDPEIFNNYDIDRPYDVVLMGTIDNKIYPFRYEALNQLINKKYFKRIPRPENFIRATTWPVKKEYVTVLNQSKITITCTSILKYPVIKFFEIPACSSVVLSNFIPELEELGFIPNENMLVPPNEQKLSQFIEETLNDTARLKTIAKNGHDLIHLKHTSEVRAHEFIQQIKEKL